MPRIYASDNDPIDFCKRCFPQTEEAAYSEFGIHETGEGPDQRGDCFDYESFHPTYEGEGYECYRCGKTLTAKDD